MGWVAVTKADRARNEKNARLDMLLSRVRAAVFSFEMDGTLASMDARSLSARLRRVMEGGSAVKPFAAYMEEVMETKVKASTRDSYAGTLAKFRAWDASCTFREMDRAWLAAFDAGMERSGLKPNSRAVHLRNLRAVFNYCIACGYTSLYPFRKFRLPHERTVKRSLSVERLRMLMSMEVEPWQEKYRDLFVLMFYLIGINAADLFPLPLPRGGRAAGVPPFQDGEALLGEGGAGGDGNHRKVQGQVVPLGRVRPGRELQGFHEADEQEPARAEPRGVRGDGGKKEEESARPPVPRLTSYWARHT